MPNPELEEQAASERPEIPASEPEISVPGPAATPAAESVPEAESAPGVESAQKSESASAKSDQSAKSDHSAKPAPSEKPAAPAGKPERRRRFRLIATVTGGVLVLGGGVLAAVWRAHGFDSAPEPDLKLVAPAHHRLAESLPWPNDGETALWAQGLGDLGTCGDQTPVPIASVAKVMTAYVVLKDHPLTDGHPGPDVDVDRQAEAESYSRDESSAPVRAGRSLSERSLLELMLVPSANNVARLLARWDAGTQDAFVAKMNAAAAALGMKNTTYTDPSGYDSATRSTAADQLKLAESAFTDPTLLALTAEPSTEVPDDPTILPNTDSLLGADGVVGGKTGSSTPAGGALMWAAHRTLEGEDHLVLGVVLHQASGTTPERGLASALLVSRRLVEAMG